VFTQEVFRDYFGYEQIDKLGYVEKDGKEGLTRQSEIIKIDSVIEAGVVVFVGCSNWQVVLFFFKVFDQIIYFIWLARNQDNVSVGRHVYPRTLVSVS
jgi:hypothetical protein